MDWWKQMVDEKRLTNPLQLSDEVLNWLAKDVQLFKVFHSDLPEQIFTYLVDGKDDSVLQEISGAIHSLQTGLMSAITSNPNSYQDYQKFLNTLQAGRKRRSQFLATVPVQDALFYYRLALLYSAVGSQFFQMTRLPLGASAWLDAFLYEVAGQDLYSYNYDSAVRNPKTLAFPISLVAAMVHLAGEPPERLMQATYLADPNNFSLVHLCQMLASLRGFADYTLQHPDQVLAALTHQDLDQRVHALGVLNQCQAPIAPFATVVVNGAIASAKKERETATPLLKRDPSCTIPHLKEKAISGKADERYYAVKVLIDLAGETERSFLEERLAVEKSAKVREALQYHLQQPEAIAPAPIDLSLPTLPVVEVNAPLPESLIAELHTIVEAAYHRAQEEYQKHQNSWAYRRACKMPTDEQFAKAWKHLQSGTAHQCTAIAPLGDHYLHTPPLQKQLFTFLERPELEPIHVVRLLILIGSIQADRDTSSPFGYLSVDYLTHYRNHHPPLLGLRELAAVFTALGLDATIIGRGLVPISYSVISKDLLKWEDEAIWPYFAEHLSMLEDALNPKPNSPFTYDYGKAEKRRIVFTILEKFPQPPSSLISKLWEIGLGGSKVEAPLAQRCLEKLPDSRQRLLTALTSGDQMVRMAAADWLGRRADPEMITPIKAALQCEKRDGVKDALMRSLEKLGASVDEFLDRSNLLKEAQTGLKKGIPDAIGWINSDRLPIVHWIDTDTLVEREILLWFVVQGYKQKNPEPSPLLRRYVAYFRPEDRQRLGQFVLEGWLGQDTLPKYTPAEAEPLAAQQAAYQWSEHQKFLAQTPDTEEKIVEQLRNQYLQYSNVKLSDMPEDQLKAMEANVRSHATWVWQQRLQIAALTEGKVYQDALNQQLKQLKGSAIKEKGVLAVAAACCGTAAVPLVQNYLKTYYGMRLAQCNALIQMLSWVEDFSAIQLVLSVANRFRTKGIQEEAERCITRLAERNGWTRDELGDRTIPWCGFSDRDTMVLDYGTRQFVGRLDRDFNIVLSDETGKAIKSLPDARKDDDETAIKAIKKQFTESKKQLKQVLTLQQERLYEAMCTQRTWSFQDWDAFLHQHPIMGRLCQRLVWMVQAAVPTNQPSLDPAANDCPPQTFRPMDDGTLTDIDDNEVAIAPDVRIAIAHASLLPPDVVQNWRSHLADYEVSSLFEQFGEVYLLPGDRGQDTEINEFEGYLLDAFQLRSKATKLGYIRGHAEDGGWFYQYIKSFTGLALQAVIEFTGNVLPEESRTVALTRLHFQALEPGDEDVYYQKPPMLLSDIPTVLLSEVWNDMRAIASQGTGYDPDWQKKAAY